MIEICFIFQRKEKENKDFEMKFKEICEEMYKMEIYGNVYEVEIF